MIMFNWTSVVLAGGGAAIGATVRYLVMQIAQLISHWRLQHSGRVPSRFPWPTFLINVSGSFMLGWVMSSGLSTGIKVLVGAGVLGGFTTFSTMANEIVLLARDQRLRLAVWYGIFSLLCGVLAAVVGMKLN